MTWTVPQPFETVEHTADTGVLVRGATREETLARLILGHAQLLSAGEAPPASETFTFELAVDDLPLVGVDALRAMNRLFCTRRLIAREVLRVRWCDRRAEVEVVVGPYDPRAHNEGLEIKAVTFHDPVFEPEGDEFVARVILDV